MRAAVAGWPVAAPRVKEEPRTGLCRRGQLAVELVRKHQPVTTNRAAEIWGCTTFAAYQRLEEAARAGCLCRSLRRCRDNGGRGRYMVHYSSPEMDERATPRRSMVQALQRICARENARLAEATADVLRDKSAHSESVRVLRAVVRDLMEELAGHGTD